MRCPFPGMDPYLERPEIWPDFHSRLLIHIAEAIQPLVPSRYAALVEHRLYVVESDRPIRPDVSVIEVKPQGFGTGGAAVAVADEPQVVEVDREEIRQPLLTIIEPAAGNRVVTAIKVLSPDNKSPGRGRESYLLKLDELWQSGANCVEIDLLRGGLPTVKAGEVDNGTPLTPYAVVVSRYEPPRHELYGFPLADRFPRIALPLGYGDPDIVLDLQAAFAKCYESGPYPMLLGYEKPLTEPLDDKGAAWCAGRLKEAGVGG